MMKRLIEVNNNNKRDIIY
ncbi:Protein CBG25986 [Caenorhabditis briggsae]|uniref:Protein CBG25986 n=1 Tax=Caenorhabditis briggsae TaxID=6238 RepID=B6IKT6_CAEBR|nr:Protein CBG25986 [Caenorhabditis briggsae]CAS00516.1 Protein CBG25986 [Caenorhabditis briggsae]